MKNNFGKAEEALERQLKKMEIDALHRLADASQQVGQPELRNIIEKSVLAASKIAAKRKALLHFVKTNSDRYGSKELYERAELPEQELKAFLLKSFQEILPEQWRQLERVKEELLQAKAAYEQLHPEKSDASIVDKERQKHINKRYNVNDKWLPLK
jgi:hypothetical protein